MPINLIRLSVDVLFEVVFQTFKVLQVFAKRQTEDIHLNLNLVHV